MKTLILMAILVASFASAVSAQEKCYTYSTADVEHQVSFTTKGRTIRGYIQVGRPNSEAPAHTYEFTGTATKTGITFAFSGGSVPDIFPDKGSRLTGSFAKGGLKLTLSTRANDRTWHSVYTAFYRACG